MTRSPRYDSTHDAERAAWEPVVAKGKTRCRRGADCLADDPVIHPGDEWDLGHPDAACPAPKAPEHRRCNRATATHYAMAGRRRAEVHPAHRV